MPNSRKTTSVHTSVAKFYDGKSIFITGAAGFVGVVLLEILLRCCSGIKSIYILLREKKGTSPQERREGIFKRSLFYKLTAEDPGVFDKVHVIAGDVSLPGMGICDEDLAKIVEDVSVVFHCAASISFTKPLKFLILNNVRGVDNVINLCKRLKTCEALLYTSTAYCNCNRKIKIEERVYKLPYTVEHFMDAIEKDDDDRLNQLFSECKPDWPNYYTFSKCLAENHMLEKASGIPTAIIRPSLVSQIWKGVLPGYAEENSSFAQLFIGIGKGFAKVLKVDPGILLDFIPVDVVANAHVISGWAVATGRCSSPFITNATSDGSYACGLGDHFDIMVELTSLNPFPNCFRYSNYVWMVHQPIKNKLLTIFEHYIPAVGLDLVLYLKGKKTRLISLYQHFDRMMKITAYFGCNTWSYETYNFRNLQNLVNSEDKKMFPTDAQNLEFRSYAKSLVSGAPFYDWKTDKKSKAERVKLSERIYYFSVFCQGIAVTLMGLLLYLLISQVVNTFLVS